MNKLLRVTIVIASIALMMPGCVRKPLQGPDYPVQPVPFSSVKLTDNFWAPRIKKNAEVTIPIAFGFCVSPGSVKNFKIKGGADAGEIQTISPFNDSDLFKTIEGASYSLQTFPDPVIDEYLDTLTKKIGLAQEGDGYILPNSIIETLCRGAGPMEPAGEKRNMPDSVLSQELYNLGHLYEAAVAHYQVTGKRTLLNIALKSADLISTDSGRERTRFYPGHAEIEMGLIKLYRITGEKKYLNLARFYLDNYSPDAEQFNKEHLKAADKAVTADIPTGALYFYSGMADIGALESDQTYLKAATKFWADLVYGNILITGGIRASSGNVEFSEPVDLQDMPVYCETYTSSGEIFFNHRMFLLYGQSKYYDLLEKILYNSMLTGIPLSADNFSLANPDGPEGQRERDVGLGSACCLSSLVRFVPSIPGYIYAVKEKEIYVNLFISNYAVINLIKEMFQSLLDLIFPGMGRLKCL